MSPFDPTEPWTLSPSIGLRPEPFGALAYHFVSRRLVFLKTNNLVELVQSLADHASVDDALDHIGLAGKRRTSHLRALESLADSGVIEPRTAVPTEAPA